jgi:hypothetical protein
MIVCSEVGMMISVHPGHEIGMIFLIAKKEGNSVDEEE